MRPLETGPLDDPRSARPAWLRGVRRTLGPALRAHLRPGVFAAAHRLGTAYARWAIRVGAPPLPAGARRFPERVARLGGAALVTPPPDRLVEARLAFLLVRALVHRGLAGGAAAASRGWPPLRVDGQEHLEAAVAGGRGAVLVTPHFGLPPLVDLLLGRLAIAGVAGGGAGDESIDVVGGAGAGVWQRARSLHRLRGALAGGAVCVLLPDVKAGRWVELPFLGGRLAITLGPFLLAQLAGCPLLPYFATCGPGATAFGVRIAPPLAPSGAPGEAVAVQAGAALVRLYEDEARRHPEQLLAYERLFGGRPAAPPPPA